MEEFYEYARRAASPRRRDDPGDDLISKLIAAEEEGDRLSDVECINLVLNVLVGGVDTTPEPARARGPAAGGAPRPVGAAARRPARWPSGGRGGAALRADHAVHRADPDRGGRVPRRDVPARARSCWCARSRGNRDGGASDADALRHHRRPRRRAAADVRRRHPLLPRREPGAGRAAGGRSRSWPSACAALALDGEPEFGTPSGIYGLEALPVKLDLA